MSLPDEFREFIKSENLFSSKDQLLLAVSGGVDSVVLCELCHQAGYDFVMAHCNFQLRGAESERDEQFAKSLGEKYGRQVLVKRFDTELYAADNKVSIQVAARELRYKWFFELVVNNEYQLLTAHHLDDNIETALLNFFKGTGIAGLRGMLPKQGNIVRPLLFAKKDRLHRFAQENNLAWVEDSSNQSDKYARNYFRNQLIPLVRNIYPEAENNLAHNLQRFRDIELLYRQSVDRHKKKLLEYRENEVYIPVLKLQKTEPLRSVLYEIIRDYHFSAGQAEEALALINSETGKYIQSATHRIIKNRNWLIISPLETSLARTILIEAPGVVEFETGSLELVELPNTNLPITGAAGIACLDAKEISFPLMLRRWKPGDYFYPLGMRKKKKLARFFIDRKLSKTQKEKIWVLECRKKIIWVLGQRIDDRFKITGSTSCVLRISLQETVQV
ncbi:MAG: tRNA lysidine(34) synthetase TilS [Bacteroidota bacterium]